LQQRKQRQHRGSDGKRTGSNAQPGIQRQERVAD
jgi:hypothetical protein